MSRDVSARDAGAGGHWGQLAHLRPPPSNFGLSMSFIYILVCFCTLTGFLKNSGPNPGSFYFLVGVTLGHGRRLPPAPNFKVVPASLVSACSSDRRRKLTSRVSPVQNTYVPSRATTIRGVTLYPFGRARGPSMLGWAQGWNVRNSFGGAQPRQGRLSRFVGRGRKAQNKRSIPLESWRLGDSRNVFFWKFTYALFWKCWFCKIRHLFRFASATGYHTGGIQTNHIWNAS